MNKFFSDEILTLISHRLKAMADPTRLKILQLLREEEMCVGDVAEQAGLKHGTASANLNALCKAGLLACRRDGTKSYYRISSDMVFNICDGVCQSLKNELDELDKLRRSIG